MRFDLEGIRESDRRIEFPRSQAEFDRRNLLSVVDEQAAEISRLRSLCEWDEAVHGPNPLRLRSERASARIEQLESAASWLLQCHDDMVRGVPVRGVDEAWGGLRSALAVRPEGRLLAAKDVPECDSPSANPNSPFGI